MSTDTRTAVITGAASGIGRASAERLAQDGLDVILLDRSPAVTVVVDELAAAGHHAHGLVADLSDLEQLESLTHEIDAVNGRCDVLVNNAGVHPKKANGDKFTVDEIDLRQWQSVLAINLSAPFFLSAWAMRGMRERQWGRIVNVASRAGRTYVDVAGAHYSSTKAGLIGMTRTLAGEGGPHNITANCVAPGRVRTPLATMGDGSHAATFAGGVPVGRLGEPDEIAAVIAFLVSDGAAFVTGSVVDVNGGAFG